MTISVWSVEQLLLSTADTAHRCADDAVLASSTDDASTLAGFAADSAAAAYRYAVRLADEHPDLAGWAREMAADAEDAAEAAAVAVCAACEREAAREEFAKLLE